MSHSLMENPCSVHRSATWLGLAVFIYMVATHVVDAGVQGQCPAFSCGDLHISYPFRRPNDPPECGEYQIACSNKATIHINTGTYYVISINYTDKYFWVVDANLDMHSNCPFRHWGQLSYYPSLSPGRIYSNRMEIGASFWACFLNCSQAIRNNTRFKHVGCLSSNISFVYISVSSCAVRNLEPSCAYLAMIPLGSSRTLSYRQADNASYEQIIELVKDGFVVEFPFTPYYPLNNTWIFKTCLNNLSSYFHDHLSGGSILKALFWSEVTYAECVYSYAPQRTTIQWIARAIVSSIFIVKLLVLCRIVFPALTVLAFLAHKYWNTRITIDAVEKFLRMQRMMGPTRYAYTDIIAITSHFRDKLGQGGYGSVYKGVLLPGNVHVAVKMLGNSNCNGDEFISEVSTIGMIHHINVVRLLGFCAEEMRRALVYEYMPHGSLDKYIFSAERRFSWDKLNAIALGIAKGINYLHRGCDMQILHFDIKPHNILLDSNFVPKVADFGLARLYPRDKSFVPASALRGTIGYIAPEMVSRSFGVISSKSDVYSFGMLLLEIAGGRRNADQNAPSSSQVYYPAWIYDRLAQQEVGEISIVEDMHELEKKLCIVGLRCIQMKPQDRPMMSEVIEMLECGTSGLKMPSRPFFCDDHVVAADSYHLSSELSAISEEDE